MKSFGNLPLRRKFLACLIVLLPVWYSAEGQSCDCPALASCSTCVGGLTSLTLQFNGSVASTIIVTDQIGAVFNDQVDPGETFSFTGSIINEKFVGTEIHVSIDGVLNATIGSSCSGFVIGKVVGNFTVRAARSKSGGSICCPAALLEKTAPVFQTCPANIALTLPDGECTVAASWTKPTASDNCGIASMTSTHEPDDEFRPGATVVTYTAKDIYGNVSTCAFTVTVTDTELPVISSCPADIKVNVSSTSCEATVTWDTPEVTDNCRVKLESAPSSGSAFQFGITPVIYTATDSAGNKSTCTFNVIVGNAEDPVITSCPGDTVVYDEGNGQAIVSWTEPVATVTCGSVTVTKTHSTGSVFPIGNTPVEYQFTDDFGKVSKCLFNVEVRTSEVSFVVQQIITPDGDGVNDRWLLPNIEKSVSNTVVVLDRWGNKVFDRSGYDNQNVYWDGTNASGKVVPTGTYFYSIEIQTGNTVVKKTGFLEVIQ